MRILLVGDSHTYGTYGQNLESALKAAGHDVARVGWVGAAAYHYLRGKEKSLGMGGIGDYAIAKNGQYDLAIVSLGTNDAAGWDGKTAAAAIQQVIGGINASGKVWVGPPAFSDNAAATYNPAFKSKNLNVRAQELYDAMSGGAGYKTLDPREATRPFVMQKEIHFGPKGGKAWAEFVVDSVSTSASTSASTQAKSDNKQDAVVVKSNGGVILVVALVGIAAFMLMRRQQSKVRMA